MLNSYYIKKDDGRWMEFAVVSGVVPEPVEWVELSPPTHAIPAMNLVFFKR